MKNILNYRVCALAALSCFCCNLTSCSSANDRPSLCCNGSIERICIIMPVNVFSGVKWQWRALDGRELSQLLSTPVGVQKRRTPIVEVIEKASGRPVIYLGPGEGDRATELDSIIRHIPFDAWGEGDGESQLRDATVGDCLRGVLNSVSESEGMFSEWSHILIAIPTRSCILLVRTPTVRTSALWP